MSSEEPHKTLSGQMRFAKLCKLNTNISKQESKKWLGKNELD